MLDRYQLLLAFVAVFAGLPSVQAQLLLTNNFNDGVADGWIEEDVNVEPFAPGIFDASSGAFVLATTGEMPAGFDGPHGTVATWEPTVTNPISDGYFQGTVRANTRGSTVSLLSRADPSVGTDYGFFASTLYGTFGIEVFDVPGNPDNPQTILGFMDREEFPFVENEDWIIKGGTIGGQITMKVWRPGEPEPAEPQLSFTDLAFEQGALCLLTYSDIGLMTEPVMFSGTFDVLSFIAVPEPSTAALSVSGLLLLRFPSAHFAMQLNDVGSRERPLSRGDE